METQSREIRQVLISCTIAIPPRISLKSVVKGLFTGLKFLPFVQENNTGDIQIYIITYKINSVNAYGST